MALMRGLLLLLVLTAGLAPRAAGQDVTLQASALLLEPLSGGAVEHLRFGEIIPGNSIEILAVDAGGNPNPNAGQWRIKVPRGNRKLHVSLVLPATLAHTTRSGFTIPVNWDGGSYLALCQESSTGCENIVTANPAQYAFPTAYTFSLFPPSSVQRNVMVYLGGKVTVPASQLAGDYIGTVTLRFYATNN